ncbi:MAG: NAD(P)H-dependent flavin oxidoreductase [Candidatus Binataceae bacterium]
MLHTPICDYFGIKYPIFLAGMGGVAMHKLVAAVSNAGGLGIIGAASLNPDQLRAEIRRTKELTDKPFAVDMLAPIPEMIRPHIPVLLEENIKIFVAGLAVPAEFIKTMHDHGMKVVVMCGKVRHGIKSQEAGADVVVAQGTEAGGHTGEIGALALIPQMLEAVRLPVLAAGGIADGRQIAAALTLGAQGVVIGTRFIATHEAQAAQVYREMILKAREDSTLRTRAYTGKTCRVIRTEYAMEWEREPEKIKPFPEQANISTRNGVMNYTGLRGDFDSRRGFMPAGQGAGLINELKPAAEVFANLLRETEAALKRAQPLLSDDQRVPISAVHGGLSGNS